MSRHGPPLGGAGSLPGLALRNLLRRPARNLAAACGVALGAAAYLLLVASARSLQDEADGALRQAGADLVVMQAGIAVPWLSRLAEKDVQEVEAAPGVRGLSRMVIGLARTPVREQLFVFGLDPNERVISTLPITAGRTPGRGSGEMVAGAAAARELGLVPGDRVELLGRTLVVTGVYASGSGLLDHAVVVDLQAAREMLRVGRFVNLVLVDVEDPEETDLVLARLHGRDLAASRVELFAPSFRRLGAVHRYARLLAGLGLAIGALGVATSLATALLERRAEIALLRALGWRKARISLLLGWEAVLLVGTGAAIALPAAAGVLALLSASDYVGFVPRHLAGAVVAEGLAAALVCGLAGAAAPLVRALGARPAAALRAW